MASCGVDGISSTKGLRNCGKSAVARSWSLKNPGHDKHCVGDGKILPAYQQYRGPLLLCSFPGCSENLLVNKDVTMIATVCSVLSRFLPMPWALQSIGRILTHAWSPSSCNVKIQIHLTLIEIPRPFCHYWIRITRIRFIFLNRSIISSTNVPENLLGFYML